MTDTTDSPLGDRPALATMSVTKRYDDLVALAPLQLRVEPGESIALLGHNGSGKTTLLRMVSGLLEPSDGSIEVFGHLAGSLGARRLCCYVPDNPVLYDDLSVAEHLEYTARLHGAIDWQERAPELLELLGLANRADDLPRTFSRGLRQKTAIAVAMVRPFELLCIDEPFVGLDASGKEVLLDLLRDMHGDGATLVVATHQLEFIEKVNRVVALRDGQLIFDGTPDPSVVRSLVEP